MEKKGLIPTSMIAELEVIFSRFFTSELSVEAAHVLFAYCRRKCV